MSLVALYMSVAERLDFPINGICIPEHIFIRWDGPKKNAYSHSQNQQESISKPH